HLGCLSDGVGVGSGAAEVIDWLPKFNRFVAAQGARLGLVAFEDDRVVCCIGIVRELLNVQTVGFVRAAFARTCMNRIVLKDSAELERRATGVVFVTRNARGGVVALSRLTDMF